MRSSSLFSVIPTLSAIAAAVTLAACGNEPTSAHVVPEASLLWRARLTPHGGLTMALNDTVQTTFVGLNLEQQPIALDSNTYHIQYSSDDPTYVEVTPSGQIIGKQVTNLFSPIRVTASLRSGNVKSLDTVYVAVTATRQVVDSVSLMPDSTRAAFFSLVFFHPTAWGGGVPLPDVYVYFSSPSQLLFGIDPIFGYAISIGAGKAWMYASTTAYGKTLADSLQFTFEYQAIGEEYVSDAPSGTGFQLNQDWSNLSVYFQPCAPLTWHNTASRPFNVTFDNPSKTGRCGDGDTTTTGNIMNLEPGESATRKFPVAGTYTWSLAASSAPSAVLNTGKIVTQ